MSDQVMHYTPGIHVWTKLINKVWWPGRVVHRSNVPSQEQYPLNKKKNVKAYVYFETDDTYITVFNEKNICSYSSASKLQHVKKGYSLYLKQMKYKVCGFDMAEFIEAVKLFENELEGDPNIFDQFVEKPVQTYPSINIKELFMTEKQRRKHKKLLAARNKIVQPRKLNKSLSVTKKPVTRKTQKNKKPLPSKKVTNSKMKTSTKINKPSSTPRSQLGQTGGNKSFRVTTRSQQFVRRTPNNIKLLPPKKVTDSEMKTTTYGCYFNPGCNFVTHRYDALKRHVRIHKDENNKKEDSITLSGSVKVFHESFASRSICEVNEIDKSVCNFSGNESDMEYNEVCDLLMMKMFADKKSKLFGSKTDNGTQHNTMINGTKDGEDKCTANDDENNDPEEIFSIHKRVTNWLQKSQEVMTKLGHTRPHGPGHAHLDDTVNQKEETLARPLSDRCKNYVWAPIVESAEAYTDEELFAMPVIRELRKHIENGEPHGASITIKGAKILSSDSSLIPINPRPYHPNPYSIVLPIDKDFRLLSVCEE